MTLHIRTTIGRKTAIIKVGGVCHINCFISTHLFQAKINACIVPSRRKQFLACSEYSEILSMSENHSQMEQMSQPIELVLQVPRFPVIHKFPFSKHHVQSRHFRYFVGPVDMPSSATYICRIASSDRINCKLHVVQQKETEKTKLLSCYHPPIQPVRKFLILSSIMKLHNCCYHTWQINQCQEGDGNHWQDFVDDQDWNFIKILLMGSHKRVNYFSQECREKSEMIQQRLF